MNATIEASVVGQSTTGSASALCQPGASRCVDLGGRRLHYLEWGEQHTAGPTLLLVHGFRAHAHWWDGIAPVLAARFRVIAMDLSGMGDSDHRHEYPAHYASQDIVDLIDRTVAGSVIGIGHSFGGSRLLRACVNRPDLFLRLIICDSFILLKGANVPQDTVNTSGKRFYPDLQTALSRYRLVPEQRGSHPQILDNIARHSVRQEPSGWCWKFDLGLPRGIRHEERGECLLPQVRRPVDVVFGECSQIVDKAMAERAVQLLPFGHGPFQIPDAQHHMMIDQPQAMIATLNRLLVKGDKRE